MPELISYRNANPADLREIVNIYNSTIPSATVTADTEPVSEASKIDWFNAHNKVNRPLWIVEQRGVIAGWVSFQDFYGRPAYRYTAEISIYLHADFRGKGLGKSVLAHSIETCRQLEIKTLLGYIFAHNIPSINLFLKADFQEWATLPGIAELHGQERSLKILGRRIY